MNDSKLFKVYGVELTKYNTNVHDPYWKNIQTFATQENEKIKELADINWHAERVGTTGIDTLSFKEELVSFDVMLRYLTVDQLIKARPELKDIISESILNGDNLLK